MGVEHAWRITLYILIVHNIFIFFYDIGGIYINLEPVEFTYFIFANVEKIYQWNLRVKNPRIDLSIL